MPSNLICPIFFIIFRRIACNFFRVAALMPDIRDRFPAIGRSDSLYITFRPSKIPRILLLIPISFVYSSTTSIGFTLYLVWNYQHRQVVAAVGTAYS